MSDDEDKITFHCDECYNRKTMTPEVIRMRHETTKLFNEEGIFEIAICERCGGVIKPYLRSIPEEEAYGGPPD